MTTPRTHAVRDKAAPRTMTPPSTPGSADDPRRDGGRSREAKAAQRQRDRGVDIVYALAEGLIIRRLRDTNFEITRYIDTIAELPACGAAEARW